jgi:hypothetical protein
LVVVLIIIIFDFRCRLLWRLRLFSVTHVALDRMKIGCLWMERTLRKAR